MAKKTTDKKTNNEPLQKTRWTQLLRKYKQLSLMITCMEYQWWKLLYVHKQLSIE